MHLKGPVSLEGEVMDRKLSPLLLVLSSSESEDLREGAEQWGCIRQCGKWEGKVSEGVPAAPSRLHTFQSQLSWAENSGVHATQGSVGEGVVTSSLSLRKDTTWTAEGRDEDCELDEVTA